MNKSLFTLVLALGIGAIAGVHAQPAPIAINDAQIAHIAYTAGEIDIAAAGTIAFFCKFHPGMTGALVVR